MSLRSFMASLFSSQLPPAAVPPQNNIGKVTLKRFYSRDDGMFSIFSYGGNFAAMIELPWRNNQHKISCIPAGVYVFHRYQSPKRGYEVFADTEKIIPGGRSDDGPIEIHIANFLKDIEGCMGIGRWFSTDAVQGKCVTTSHDAFSDFMAWAKNYQSIQITITEV
jgi:hypothetical protein